MATQKRTNNPADTASILQHDYEETSREQDRERAHNRHSFDSSSDSDDDSTHRDQSEYSENRNQSRFTDENDYPDGNTERYNERTNEQQFSRDNALNDTGRAYDRSADYVREREDDTPFINQNPDEFYGQSETREKTDQRYFGGDMGYHTKQDQTEQITKSVIKKSSTK